MSKLNQIQAKLQEIDPATFQQLCDNYLYKKGFEKINPLGLVIGKNKVSKGTPDTLVLLPNGKFVFAEYTTIDHDRLFGKIKDDLDKCFDVQKTKVPIEQIQEIVYCHTSKLSPDEEFNLLEQARSKGCVLNIFGLGPISHDLYNKYPNLAKEYLHVEIDTGQILDLDDFIKEYGRSRFAAPLDTEFQFREAEILSATSSLEESDLLLVSGRAGVGKTRFAIECCERFIKQATSFQAKVVVFKNADLYDDLQTYFSPPGDYVILVDDANRVRGYEYVLGLLQTHTENRRIKLIVTVRDYALSQVRDVSSKFVEGREISLLPLSADQTTIFLAQQFGIVNSDYTRRIFKISEGNARLIVMAARIALQNNTLTSIADVSGLYEEYFKSVKKDLEEFRDKELLKVSGMISFFRVVDRNNDYQINLICEMLKISPDTFWNLAHKLHELEIVDMYEGEIVRVSDQILSTYILFLIFFRDRLLLFSDLLIQFFPSFRARFIDVINSLLIAFDRRGLEEVFLRETRKARRVFEDLGNVEATEFLLETFWFIYPSDVVNHLKSLVEQLPQESLDEAEWNFKPNPNDSNPRWINLYKALRFADLTTVSMSVELLCDHMARQQSRLPALLNILVESYGIKHTSKSEGYRVEQKVIDIFISRMASQHRILFAKVFLTIAKKYLQIAFHTMEPSGPMSITVVDFHLVLDDELKTLREKIWKCLFDLYKNMDGLKKEVLNLFLEQRYPRQGLQVNQIAAFDLQQVSIFFRENLHPDRFDHCLVVLRYLNQLERLGVEIDKSIKANFEKNETYKLYDLMLDNMDDKFEMGVESYNQLRASRFKALFDEFTLKDYCIFFDRCAQIEESLSNSRYRFADSFVNVLSDVSSQDCDLYVNVLNEYFCRGNPFDIASVQLVNRLIECVGGYAAYEILNQQSFKRKHAWLFACFMSPAYEPSAASIEQLLELYESSSYRDIPSGNWDYLIRYIQFDGRIFINSVNIILSKASNDPAYYLCLEGLFNHYSESAKQLPSLFADDAMVLKQAYLHAHLLKDYVDHDGFVFNVLMDMDPGFIVEYIDWVFSQKEYVLRYEEQRDYRFIWHRNDFKIVMQKLINRAWVLHQTGKGVSGFLIDFFVNQRDEPYEDNINIRQVELLESEIKTHAINVDLMELLFEVVAHFEAKRRIHLLKVFLGTNTNFDDFKKLQLEPRSTTWSGSRVPGLQKQIDFYQSLLSDMSTLALIQHKVYIERIIDELQELVQEERKRDFIGYEYM